MIWIDFAILGIVALSAVVSVIRGFVREALSLAAWIASFWVALTFTEELAVMFTDYISVPSLRLVTAFAILFLVTLLITSLVAYMASQLVRKTGLTGTDRMLGVIFGLIRGAVIIAILVLLAGLTPMPHDPWWKESIFIVHFQEMALWLRGFLPPDIAQNFQYT